MKYEVKIAVTVEAANPNDALDQSILRAMKAAGGVKNGTQISVTPVEPQKQPEQPTAKSVERVVTRIYRDVTILDPVIAIGSRVRVRRFNPISGTFEVVRTSPVKHFIVHPGGMVWLQTRNSEYFGRAGY